MVAFFLRDQVCALIGWWLDVWFSFPLISFPPSLPVLPSLVVLWRNAMQ